MQKNIQKNYLINDLKKTMQNKEKYKHKILHFAKYSNNSTMNSYVGWCATMQRLKLYQGRWSIIADRVM